MTQSSLPNHLDSVENHDDDPNRYEILCTKLHQMQSIANVTVKSSHASEREVFEVLCSLADLLAEAASLCDNLTPHDIPDYKKTRMV